MLTHSKLQCHGIVLFCISTINPLSCFLFLLNSNGYLNCDKLAGIQHLLFYFIAETILNLYSTYMSVYVGWSNILSSGKLKLQHLLSRQNNIKGWMWWAWLSPPLLHLTEDFFKKIQVKISHHSTLKISRIVWDQHKSSLNDLGQSISLSSFVELLWRKQPHVNYLGLLEKNCIWT